MEGIHIPVPANSTAAALNTALADFTEMQGSFVEDNAGNILWLEIQVNESDGTVERIYYQQPGGAITSPVGAVGPVEQNRMQTITRFDDVNGDASFVQRFYRLNIYSEEGDIQSSKTVNSDGSPYIVQGVERDSDKGRPLVTSFDFIANGDTNIPEGFRHASIAVLSGIATINGVVYQKGEVLALPPMPDSFYPQYSITAITGSVRVNYHV